MKLIMKISIFIVAITVGNSAIAQDIKVGFINLPVLIEASPQAKSATKKLQMKFTPRQKSIAIEAERYNSLVKKLEKDALILSNEQQVEIKAEILKLERKVKRDEQEFREELNVQKNIEFKKTRDVILKVIEKLAIDEKYDLIITEGAIYASKKVNISQQVLDLLEIENKKSALVKQK